MTNQTAKQKEDANLRRLEIINIIREELTINIKDRSDDYYNSRARSITVQLIIGDDVITSDSFSIMNGEPSRDPY